MYFSCRSKTSKVSYISLHGAVLVDLGLPHPGSHLVPHDVPKPTSLQPAPNGVAVNDPEQQKVAEVRGKDMNTCAFEGLPHIEVQYRGDDEESEEEEGLRQRPQFAGRILSTSIST